MKKTVKLLSGLALAAAFIVVSFSSFSAPEEAVSTPEALVSDGCECPPGWFLSGYPANEEFLKIDRNEDGLVCGKRVKGKGNLETFPGFNAKDNNQPCD